MSEIKKSFVKLAAATVLLGAVLACSVVSFGWFSKNDTVSSSGMRVSVEGDLEILAARDEGGDIGVYEPSADMEHLPGATQDSIVRPGAAGCIEFYVRDPERETLDFSYELGAVNDEFFADGSDGFYAGTSDTRRTQALKYLNSHIMFFRNFDGTTYSDWIRPGETVSHSGAENPCRVRAYWVWVPWYDNIFSTDADRLIDEADKDAIAAYYSASAAADELFVGANVGEQGYNEADYIIGTTLQYICIEVKVRRADNDS